MLIVPCAVAQDFGRFGYVQEWVLPDLKLDRTSFSVRGAGSSTFRFASKNLSWKAVQTGALGQIVALNGPGVKKARSNLLGLGFELYCDGPFAVHLTDTQAPYLSFSGGSVGPRVPTAPSKWVVASFRNAQPPVAFGFLGDPAALQISGKAGDWTVQTVGTYKGWIRIAAPMGATPFRTNSAGELGELAVKLKPIVDELGQPSTQLLGSTVRADSNGLEWILSFDRKGAVIPMACQLASLGGYPVKVSGEPIATSVWTEEGPVYLSSIETLKIRLPSRRVPFGRSLATGATVLPGFGTVSPLHIPGVVEVGLAMLSGSCETNVSEMARKTLEEYFESASYHSEPNTLTKLPFGADGSGIDVVAANAVLQQCIQNAQAQDAAQNALLQSVAARRDWATCSLFGMDPKVAKRAAALAAIAGSLSPDPVRRLDGALFEAGLAGRKGLSVWRRRRGAADPETPEIEPMKDLRAALFGKRSPTALFQSWMSDIRYVGPRGLLVSRNGQTYTVTGFVEGATGVSFGLHSGFPIQIKEGKNATNLSVTDSLGDYKVEFRASAAGPFEIVIEAPEWAPPLPAFAPPSIYTE